MFEDIDAESDDWLFFYFNVETQEKRPDPPKGLEDAFSSGDVVLSDWMPVFDDSAHVKKYYWFNRRTGWTQWEKPLGLGVDAQISHWKHDFA